MSFPINLDDYKPTTFHLSNQEFSAEQKENITVNIDHKQRGVGGDWPALARTHKEFKLKGYRKYSYSYRIKLVEKGTEDIKQLLEYELPF